MSGAVKLGDELVESLADEFVDVGVGLEVAFVRRFRTHRHDPGAVGSLRVRLAVAVAACAESVPVFEPVVVAAVDAGVVLIGTAVVAGPFVEVVDL